VPDNATLRQRIGERIEAARGDRTRTDVAKALGVSTQTVWNWETGVALPALERQTSIADALGVAWSDLFSLDGEVA
jgi:DNA-binding XRE family transcriptional regulator